MRRGWLLELYPRRWRERYGAEIADLLSRERLSARLVIDLIRGALDAHTHPDLARPVLAAAGGGSMQVPSRSSHVGLVVLIVVLMPFVLLGSLYAYRSQTPAVPAVPVTQAMSDVQAGHVAAVEFSGMKATIILVDGSRQQTNVADASGEPLTGTVNEYNLTHAAAKVRLDYGSDANPFALVAQPIASVLITLLPFVLLALLVLLLARRLKSIDADAERTRRYEWLTRIAELRDRGVLTEEEFQREKTRVLE